MITRKEIAGIICSLALVAVGIALASVCRQAAANDRRSYTSLNDESVRRYGPDEFGVVCYQIVSYAGVSCVKVQAVTEKALKP